MAWEIEEWEEPCEAPTLYYGRDCEITKIEFWEQAPTKDTNHYVVQHIPPDLRNCGYQRELISHVYAVDELAALQQFRKKRFV